MYTDATSLASFLPPKTTRSKILVGGDQITLFNFDQYTDKDNAGTAITEGRPLQLKDMHIASQGSNMDIWYTDAHDGAFYYATDMSTPSSGNLVQLLSAGKGGRLSGLLSTVYSDSHTLLKSLVSVNETGNLTLLQQASDTGMWEQHQMYVAADTDIIHVPSYTVRLQAVTDKGSKDPNEYTNKCRLHVRSSGATTLIVNGKSSVTTSNGTWFDCDSTGTLTCIISTADLACHSITVDQFLAASETEPTKLSSTTLDPSVKVNKDPRVQALKTAQDLKDAKTQGREARSLIRPGSVSDDDLKSASQLLTSISTANVPSPPAKASSMPRLNMLPQSCQPLDIGKSENVVEIGGGHGSLWDFFHHLYEIAEDIAEYWTEITGEVTNLLIKWAGKIYRFVLDTSAAISKAISWVFKKIKVLVQDLIDFVGFLFEWDDILTTTKSISALVNCAMVYSSNKISKSQKQTDILIDDIKKGIAQKTKPKNMAIGSSTSFSG